MDLEFKQGMADEQLGRSSGVVTTSHPALLGLTATLPMATPVVGNLPGDGQAAAIEHGA